MSALTFFLMLWAQVGGQAGAPGPEAAPPAASTAAEQPGAEAGAEVRAEAAAGAAASPEAAVPIVPPMAVAFRNLKPWQEWALIYGNPGGTVSQWWGPLLAWAKILALLCLVGWVGAWVLTSLRDRPPPRVNLGGLGVLDAVALAAVFIGIASVFVRVAQTSGQLAEIDVAGFPLAAWIGVGCLGVLVLWLEVLVWSGIIRARRGVDLLVLIGVHLALAAGLGVGVSVLETAPDGLPYLTQGLGGWAGALMLGAQMALTYMGFVVLVRVALLVLSEVLAVRPRRLYSLGLFSWIESFRKTRIPWAVLAIFVVILSFTHWFLQPPSAQRQAELSRLYVGTLMLLCSFLLTIMVAILTPITLPNDIRFQTIFTVVTKPVRRLEIIWGRILGFMAVVTVLLLALGGISLIYLDRNVGSRITALEQEIEEARAEGLDAKADLLAAQLDQLQTRLSARLPVEGSLTFIDSLGEPRIKGIDVGQELEIRSFIEGATQSKAIWQFGPNLPHPIDRLFPNHPGEPYPPIDAPVPLHLLLKAGTIEHLGNQIAELGYQKAALQQRKQQGIEASELSRINNQINDLDRRIAELSDRRQALVDQQDALLADAQAAEQAGDDAQARALREQAEALSSPPVPVQMTFTVYRTTKGRPGEPVYASIEAINPLSPESDYRETFPIKEYYTNKWEFPASVLVGSRGYLTLEVQCLSATQYLGMAEDDLFVVADQGAFWINYLKGLAGIWLKAMVLTTIGVFAGTFLSWPVALLTTIFFFGAGEMLFPILRDLATNAVVGGGPFESMIRLVTHENQMTELDPTLGVILAQSFDAIVVPIMSLLIYVVPNFSAMDLSDAVADGFAVTWGSLAGNALLALAYALPFSIAGYFILKNREVAA